MMDLDDRMWSHVKFLGEDQIVNVKTSFFKDVVEGTLTPRQLTVNSVYKVFWSPEPSETPTDIMENGNTIVDISDLSGREKERRAKANKGPLKGYYEAMLISLRDSEDSFDEVSKVKTQSGKRLHIPSQKVAENLLQVAKAGSSKGHVKRFCKDSKKEEKLAAEEASEKNLMALFQKCTPPNTLTSTAPTSAKDYTSSSHSISEEPKKSEQSASIDELKRKKKMKNSKKKSHKKDSDDSAEYWKKKFLELNSAQTLQKDESLPQKSNLPSSKQNEQSKVPPVTGPNHEEHNIKEDKITTPVQCVKDTSVDELPQNSWSDGEEPTTKKTTEKSASEKELTSEPESSTEAKSSKKKVTKFVVKKGNVKAGRHGDSLFITNTAAKLWPIKTMAIRSVTGLPASAVMKKNGTGYPRLTPKKVEKVVEALTERIKTEEPALSAACISDRVGSVGYVLSQKICTARRSLRAKGIRIPSAEEAHAKGLEAYDSSSSSSSSSGEEAE